MTKLLSLLAAVSTVACSNDVPTHVITGKDLAGVPAAQRVALDVSEANYLLDGVRPMDIERTDVRLGDVVVPLADRVTMHALPNTRDRISVGTTATLPDEVGVAVVSCGPWICQDVTDVDGTIVRICQQTCVDSCPWWKPVCY